jgi:hypothetical protein
MHYPEKLGPKPFQILGRLTKKEKLQHLNSTIIWVY